jgi:tellurite resistance protein
VNPKIASEVAAVVRKAADPLKLIRQRFLSAAEGCRQLPPPQRHAVIQQLIAVAKANSTVAEAEKRTLHEICVALEVNPAFTDRILSQYDVDYVFARMH